MEKLEKYKKWEKENEDRIEDIKTIIKDLKREMRIRTYNRNTIKKYIEEEEKIKETGRKEELGAN